MIRPSDGDGGKKKFKSHFDAIVSRVGPTQHRLAISQTHTKETHQSRGKNTEVHTT